MSHTKYQIRGVWTKIVQRHGETILSLTGENIVVNNGLEYLTGYLVACVNTSTSNPTWPMRYMAVGRNGTTEAATDSRLGAEHTRVAGTLVTTLYLGVYETMRLIATFPAGSNPVEEYGVFSVATLTGSEPMWARDVEPLISLTVRDTLSVYADFFFVGT